MLRFVDQLYLLLKQLLLFDFQQYPSDMMETNPLENMQLNQKLKQI